MSEVSRELLIRLPVDQEVYAEQVASGDTVQDATVATEIVAFDQDRDTYQLEGAIVFAAYVQKATSGDVVHVHQRLPFLLRVPASAQQSGVLNVKSRLAGVQLDVTGDAWLHLGGWLEVHGLNGSQGYLFRCGAQEVHEAVPSPEPVAPADAHLLSPLADPAFDLALRGEAEGTTAGRAERSDDGTPEARGGPDATGDTSEGAGESPEPMSPRLAEFDKFLPSSQAADEMPAGSPEVGDTAPPPSISAADAPVASFEFVHQVDDLAPGGDEVERAPATDASAHGFVPAPGEAVAARKALDVASGEQETEEDAKPSAPKVAFFASARSEGPEPAEAAVPSTDGVNAESVEASEPAEVVRHEFDASKSQNKKLWSFVDFNAPEPRHTLRFVIVLENETLETVAERCGVLPSELERANPWLQGPPEPGTALLVPERRLTIQKVVTLS
ncbi:hypothetical protein [Alicyclobacillus vulcanalis]|uniref:LysM domain-containing protein n=1 Tax=Alicyclobacillus vulcanalis TaxID=252246 RepID=A0A1N7KQU0_9BACL|nr:hypothetical protein [Alicyclobacillus vulcanalis]SIS63973.1 hypothetical protein SAMN05421799_102121 [Alicyclobacillus vulcanalis]